MVINMKKCMDSENLHRRLKKIIGQVQAIDRMVDEDVPCEDVLAQLNAAKSALNKCGQIVLEGHINHCIKDAIESGDEEEIKNFTKAIERFANMQETCYEKIERIVGVGRHQKRCHIACNFRNCVVA